MYTFKGYNDPEPQAQLQEVEPEVAPFPQYADALTVEQFYAQHAPARTDRRTPVREWHVEDGWVWVYYPWSKETDHHWWGWRFARVEPKYLFIAPAVVDTRQPIAQMRDPL